MLFFLCVVLLHFLQFSPIIYSGVARTRALEPLSLAGAAFVLASALPLGPSRSARNSYSGILRKFGLILFAFPMLIFGLQHFLSTRRSSPPSFPPGSPRGCSLPISPGLRFSPLRHRCSRTDSGVWLPSCWERCFSSGLCFSMHRELPPVCRMAMSGPAFLSPWPSAAAPSWWPPPFPENAEA